MRAAPRVPILRGSTDPEPTAPHRHALMVVATPLRGVPGCVAPATPPGRTRTRARRHAGRRSLLRDRRPLLHQAPRRRRGGRGEGRAAERRFAPHLALRRTLRVPQHLAPQRARRTRRRPRARSVCRRRRGGRERPGRLVPLAGSPGTARAKPGRDRRVDHPVRPGRAVGRLGRVRVHPAGLVRLHVDARAPRGATGRGRRADRRMGRGHLRRGGRPRCLAPGNAHRRRRARRRRAARLHGAHDEHLHRGLRRVPRLAADEAPDPVHRDPLDRADVGRLRGRDDQQRTAVRRLPPPHRPTRHARGRGSHHVDVAFQAARRGARDDVRVHAPAHDGRGARQGHAAAHPQRPGRQR